MCVSFGRERERMGHDQVIFFPKENVAHFLFRRKGRIVGVTKRVPSTMGVNLRNEFNYEGVGIIFVRYAIFTKRGFNIFL